MIIFISTAPMEKEGVIMTIFEQGLGLFGSPEGASLMDEIVAIAYEERRRPSKRHRPSGQGRVSLHTWN